MENSGGIQGNITAGLAGRYASALFDLARESNAIDAQEYGTAFTSEAFVLQRMAETCGTDALVHRAPVHFWNHQDAYVLRRA